MPQPGPTSIPILFLLACSAGATRIQERATKCQNAFSQHNLCLDAWPDATRVWTHATRRRRMDCAASCASGWRCERHHRAARARHHAEVDALHATKQPDGQRSKTCQAHAIKIFRFIGMATRCMVCASHPIEGRLRIVTGVAVRCGGRGSCQRRKHVKRTAKSCGPDALAAGVFSQNAKAFLRRR